MRPGRVEFADFTTVALTVAANATIDRFGGALLTGTLRCSRDETFDLYVELQQLQKSGKTTAEVHANATPPIACTTSVPPQPGDPLHYATMIHRICTAYRDRWV